MFGVKWRRRRRRKSSSAKPARKRATIGTRVAATRTASFLEEWDDAADADVAPVVPDVGNPDTIALGSVVAVVLTMDVVVTADAGAVSAGCQ